VTYPLQPLVPIFAIVRDTRGPGGQTTEYLRTAVLFGLARASERVTLKIQGREEATEQVKRLIEITPSQLKLYEAIGRDFPDLSPAQTARIVAIVREWMQDEVNRVKAELVSGNFVPNAAGVKPLSRDPNLPQRSRAALIGQG